VVGIGRVDAANEIFRHPVLNLESFECFERTACQHAAEIPQNGADGHRLAS
jgi:hypothetical protein